MIRGTDRYAWASCYLQDMSKAVIDDVVKVLEAPGAILLKSRCAMLLRAGQHWISLRERIKKRAASAQREQAPSPRGYGQTLNQSSQSPFWCQDQAWTSRSRTSETH